MTIAAAILGAAVLFASASVISQEGFSEGRKLFFEQGCYGCHTVGVIGTPIGPDLSRVGGKYPRSYIERWLRDPSLQKPAAHMPKIELTEAEVRALAAYLASLD